MEASSKAQPAFLIRTRLLSRRCYVVARWSDGRREKVARFSDREAAQDWIDHFAMRWLADRIAR